MVQKFRTRNGHHANYFKSSQRKERRTKLLPSCGSNPKHFPRGPLTSAMQKQLELERSVDQTRILVERQKEFRKDSVTATCPNIKSPDFIPSAIPLPLYLQLSSTLFPWPPPTKYSRTALSRHVCQVKKWLHNMFCRRCLNGNST